MNKFRIEALLCFQVLAYSLMMMDWLDIIKRLHWSTKNCNTTRRSSQNTLYNTVSPCYQSRNTHAANQPSQANGKVINKGSVKPGNSSHPLSTTCPKPTIQDGQQAQEKKQTQVKRRTTSITDEQRLGPSQHSTTILLSIHPRENGKSSIREAGGSLTSTDVTEALARGEVSRRDH